MRHVRRDLRGHHQGNHDAGNAQRVSVARNDFREELRQELRKYPVDLSTVAQLLRKDSPLVARVRSAAEIAGPGDPFSLEDAIVVTGITALSRILQVED